MAGLGAKVRVIGGHRPGCMRVAGGLHTGTAPCPAHVTGRIRNIKTSGLYNFAVNFLSHFTTP